MMNKLAASLLAIAAGCTSGSDGDFHITGRLLDASAVTHVIATDVTSGERIVIDMKDDGQADGRFDVALPTTGSWIITFASVTKVGPAARIATLQTGGLDAFIPVKAGSLDFGDVHFSGARAHGEMQWDRLERAFDTTREALEAQAANDDLALRYSNPDVDGDGSLDALQGRDYRLDITGTFRMQRNGEDATMRDLVLGMANPDVRYMGTTINAAVPRAMGMNMRSGTLTFDDAFFGTALGMYTPMVAPKTPVGQPHVKFGELAGDPQVGVVAHPDYDAPRGSYKFNFDNGALTFVDVLAPSVQSLADGAGYTVPFVRVRPVVDGCEINCEIASVDLEWKRLTTQGWATATAPSDVHLDAVAMFRGERTYLAANFAGESSLAWSAMPVRNTGLLRSELAHISTGEICYFAISYTSELGMKMTSQVSAGCQ